MQFKVAKLDRVATIITVSVTAFLVVLSAFFVLEVPYGWIFTILMLSIIVFAYLLSPSSYSIESGRLVIRKVIGKKMVIPLDEVQGYSVIPDLAKTHISRTFGNGGLFGYYGIFSTLEYGAMNCQLTRLKQTFLIRTGKGTYALSPADTARFTEYFESAVQGSGGTIEQLVPTAAEKARYANPLILLLPAAILIITVVAVLSLYSGLPERIAVHFDLQGNPNGWASRTSFVISGLIPACILFMISTVIFFYVRRTTTKATLSYMIVGLFSVFQLFAAYVTVDTYWVNRYDSHLIPFPYSVIIYGVIIIALLFVYYQKTKLKA